MKSKVMIAGAIGAAVLICALAAVALSHSTQGQVQKQETCSVSGYVVNTFGKGMSGLTVTLHVLGDLGPDGQANELYNLTTVTNAEPHAGQYAFDSVAITPGAKYAYIDTSTKTGDITSYGRSNNYTLTANGNLTMAVVLKLPP